MPLPKSAASSLIEDANSLVARSPEKFRDEYGIDVRTRHEVTKIDPVRQQVTIKGSENRKTTESYDQLLIATGARPFCPQVPGSGADGIFGLSTLASGIRVQQFFEQIKPRTAVVVGGGYIGLEMAETWCGKSSMSLSSSAARRSWGPSIRIWANSSPRLCETWV